jgi:hypothetical protein
MHLVRILLRELIEGRELLSEPDPTKPLLKRPYLPLVGIKATCTPLCSIQHLLSATFL